MWEFLCFIYLFTLFWGLVVFFFFSFFFFLEFSQDLISSESYAEELTCMVRLFLRNLPGCPSCTESPGSIHHVTGQLNTWRLGIRAHHNEAFWPESFPVTTGGSAQHERFSLMRNPVQHIPEFEVPDRVLRVQKYLWPEHCSYLTLKGTNQGQKKFVQSPCGSDG